MVHVLQYSGLVVVRGSSFMVHGSQFIVHGSKCMIHGHVYICIHSINIRPCSVMSVVEQGAWLWDRGQQLHTGQPGLR